MLSGVRVTPLACLDWSGQLPQRGSHTRSGLQSRALGEGPQRGIHLPAPTGAAVGEAIRERREAILRVAAAHGATQVRLVGSVARGQARPDSDVDLLVTWQAGTSLLDQAALTLELESLLGRKVDIASDGWVKPSIRESVYRDAIAL
ncbi:MAG: nucleotidyltransferase family protein [Bryobacteraceae bacterium]